MKALSDCACSRFAGWGLMGQTGEVSRPGDPCCKPVCCAPHHRHRDLVRRGSLHLLQVHRVGLLAPHAASAKLLAWLDGKPGLLGRKVLTYKFPCGECVEVVITKHGKDDRSRLKATSYAI